MKINNNRKGIIGVSIGIISAWIAILTWAVYKGFPTDKIILFIMVFICTAIVPMINLWKHGNDKCNLK